MRHRTPLQRCPDIHLLGLLRPRRSTVHASNAVRVIRGRRGPLLEAVFVHIVPA